MKKIIAALSVVSLLCGCDKKPEQQFDLKCGDFRVSGDLYPDRVDLKMVRVAKTNTTFDYDWTAKQMPMIDDSIEISLPKVYAKTDTIPHILGEHVFDNGRGEIQFSLDYERHTDSAYPQLGVYIDELYAKENNIPSDRRLSRWMYCTPLLKYNYPVPAPDNPADITPGQAKEIKNCLAEIGKYNFCSRQDDETGKWFYLTNCEQDDWYSGPDLKIPADTMLQLIGKSAQELAALDRVESTALWIYYQYGYVRAEQTDACDVAARIREYVNSHMANQ